MEGVTSLLSLPGFLLLAGFVVSFLSRRRLVRYAGIGLMAAVVIWSAGVWFWQLPGLSLQAGVVYVKQTAADLGGPITDLTQNAWDGVQRAFGRVPGPIDKRTPVEIIRTPDYYRGYIGLVLLLVRILFEVWTQKKKDWKRYLWDELV